MSAVTEFVHYYTIKNFRRHQYQKAVEIEIPVYRTASPARFLQADKDAVIGNACHFGVVLYPLRNYYPRFFLDLSDVFFCERAHGVSQFRLLFNLFNLLCNPVLFFADKVFCNKSRRSKRHFYDDFLVICHLDTHRASSGFLDYVGYFHGYRKDNSIFPAYAIAALAFAVAS